MGIQILIRNQTESRTPTNDSSRDENENDDINDGNTRAAIAENAGAITANDHDDDVTYWYHAACECGIAVTSTVIEGLETWSFIKCVSVVMEPLSHAINQTYEFFNADISIRIQTDVCYPVAVDTASRDADGNSFIAAVDTSLRMKGKSPSAMVVTRSHSTVIRRQQQLQEVA